jgi:hypothetical protein
MRKFITEFQRETVEGVEGLLAPTGTVVTLIGIPCKGDEGLRIKPGDVYYTAAFNRTGKRVAVYVYDDEAGFSIDGTWKGFERPDFADSRSLMVAFLKELEESL